MKLLALSLIVLELNLTKLGNTVFSSTLSHTHLDVPCRFP